MQEERIPWWDRKQEIPEGTGSLFYINLLLTKMNPFPGDATHSEDQY